jgi:hypothetical protein
MASLFNNKISNTYVGLIKTIDNAVISSSLRELTDGSGNATGIHLNNAGDFKVTNILEFGSLKDTGENITITKFVDEADGIGNNDNDTSIPTSAAVKDFVTSQITLEDLDFRGDDASVQSSVDLDSQVFAIIGTANEIETSTSVGSQQLQIGLPTNVTIGGNLSFGDNGRIRFGTDNDFEIYHNGSNSYIDEGGTGNLYLRTSESLYIQRVSNGDNIAQFTGGGGSHLYYNNNLKISTTNTGIDVTGNVIPTGSVRVPDGEFLSSGNSNDLGMTHSGSEGSITNHTGHLNISNVADDSDIIFKSDDNSGGVTEYFRVDGGVERNIFSKSLRLLDDVQLDIGSSDDFRIVHTSANNNTYVQNYTGDLQIENHADDKDILFRCDDNSGGLETYFFLDGSENRVTSNKNFRFIDNAKLELGTSGDLEIYHDGSNSYIKDTGSGGLRLSTNQFRVYNSAVDELIINSVENGAVELYYDNSKKFETSAGGVIVNGTIDSTGTITVTGANGNVGINTDSGKLLLGASYDLQIYHDGSNSYINEVGTGDLYVQSNGTNIFFRNQSNGNTFIAMNTGTENVSLRQAGNEKLSTTSTGVTVTGGIITSDDITIQGGTARKLYINSSTHNAGVQSTATLDFGYGHSGSPDSIARIQLKENANNSFDGNLIFSVPNNNGAGGSEIVEALTIKNTKEANFAGSVVIAQDLTVNGTTTTVNTSTLAVEDPLISMAKDNSVNSVDIGFYGRYNDGSNRYLGLFADASDSNTFNLFKGTTTEPTTTVDTTATGYTLADLNVGNVALGDNTKITFGAVPDFEIFHNSTTNVNHIQSLLDRQLALNGNTIFLRNQDNDTNFLQVSSSGATFNSSITATSISLSGASIPIALTNITDGNAFLTINHSGNENWLFRCESGSGTTDFITINASGKSEKVKFGENGEIVADGSIQATGLIETSSVIQTVNGSVGAPSHTFSSDLNTGMFRSGTDTIGFATGGSLALTLADNDATFAGNVNIQNASTPLLTIKDTTNDVNILIGADDTNTFLRGSSGSLILQTNGSNAALTLDASQNATFAGSVNINNSSGDTLTLTKGTTEPSLRIEGDTDKDFVITVSGELLTFTQNDGATDILTLDHDTKNATFAGQISSPVGGFSTSANVNSTGDSGVNIASGSRLGFDQSGTRSWTINAASGNLNINSGDGNGSFSTGTKGIIAGSGTFSGNVTTTGSTIKVDNTGSASYVVDRGNDTSGATFEYNTNGTIKWFTGLRGLSSEDFYFFNYGTGATAIQIESANSNTTFAGSLTVNGAGNSAFYGDLYVASGKKFISSSSSSGDYVRLYAGSGTAQWDIYGNGENLRLSENSSGGGIFQVDSGATFGGKITSKSSQDSSFDEGIGVIRSNSSQTGYINMVGGAMNINAPSGIPIKFRDGGVENVAINAYGSVVKTVSGVSKGATQYGTSSTTNYTDILTFDTITNNRAYSVLLSSSENNFSQMYRVSGSVHQSTCLKFELGDSGHSHSKDVEFRITDVSGVRTLQVKAISHTTLKTINVYDVCVALGDVTFA